MAFLDWVSVGGVTVAALLAGLATVRVRTLNRLAGERSLARLALFFDALLVAHLAEAIGAALVLVQDPAALREGFGLLDVLFWLRHGAWLVAILFAVGALGSAPARQEAPVVAAWLLVAHPVLLLVQGIGFLYLVLRAAVNHVRKTNLGSLGVAFGFGALAAARFLPFVVDADGPAPLGAPHLATALLLVAGTWALLIVVPGRRGPPDA